MNHPSLRNLIISVAIAALFLVSATSPQITEAQQNVSVLFILDNSGSMTNNDPNDLRYSAAKLFVSLLNEGDAVGAIIFSDDAQALTSGIEQITSQEDKSALGDKFEPIPANGYTDVKAAFTLAEEMLKNSGSSRGQSAIIFLTDGQPESVSQPAL